ncbi:hypothetical protein GF325_15855 [Candidatus Bathyarchaeota archaeon]|nr:hypothetical protein [Candidatus Bathyarchaeota archaeon]
MIIEVVIVASPLANTMDKLRDILVQRGSIQKNTIPELLKVNQEDLDQILTKLEEEGVLERKRELDKGHQVLKVIYKGETTTIPFVLKDSGKKWTFLEESPCFFCRNFDKCGADPLVNFLKCTKLNSWLQGK